MVAVRLSVNHFWLKELVKYAFIASLSLASMAAFSSTFSHACSMARVADGHGFFSKKSFNDTDTNQLYERHRTTTGSMTSNFTPLP